MSAMANFRLTVASGSQAQTAGASALIVDNIWCTPQTVRQRLRPTFVVRLSSVGQLDGPGEKWTTAQVVTPR
jgi:hypothetical protein